MYVYFLPKVLKKFWFTKTTSNIRKYLKSLVCREKVDLLKQVDEREAELGKLKNKMEELQISNDQIQSQVSLVLPHLGNYLMVIN